MPAPRFSAADFTGAILACLPTGLVWPREPDSVLARILGTLAPSYARQTDRAGYLLTDAFPDTTLELLPEWEATLGLPDPCAGSNPTLQQRQAQVRARFRADGGQSAAYLTAAAARLGYAITITQFQAFKCGASRCGDPLCGEAWAHAFQVNAPPQTITYFRAGASAAGEPLQAWGNSVLQCEITALAPAHTVPIFLYA